MTKQQRERVEPRFWSKVAKGEGCWEWQASYFSGRPYGLFRLNGRNMKAHRVSFMLVRGRIRRGLVLLHSCDNPRCVRPEHLTPGTHAENMLDMRRKGRGCVHERKHNARLDANDAATIRSAWTLGATQEAIAKAFSISRSTVKDIVLARTWTSVVL